MHTYKITPVGPTWAVVESVDGEATGADAHWFREALAERAKRLYHLFPEYHGKSERTVSEAFEAFFRSPFYI